MKLYKLKRNRIEIDAPKIPAPFQPGIRPDNDWIQYTPNMSESDLAAYWKKPFSVKPEQGFYAYKKVTKLRVVDDRVLSEPDFLNEAYMNFFMDKSKVIYRRGIDNCSSSCNFSCTFLNPNIFFQFSF